MKANMLRNDCKLATVMLRRIIASCLVIVMLASVGEPNIFADSNNAEIYYSDLFYGYSPSYLIQGWSESGYNKAVNFMVSAPGEYLESADSSWTIWKEVLSSPGNLKTLLQRYADMTGRTDFTYENSLDAANAAFAKELISKTSEIYDGTNYEGVNYGIYPEIAKRAKDIMKIATEVWNKIEDKDAGWGAAEQYGYLLTDGTLDYYWESLKEEQIRAAFRDVSKVEELSGYVSMANDTFKLCKALSLALMMEDLRGEIIEDVIASATPGSDLHTGMLRLKSQLDSGGASYFLENYAKSKVIDKLFSIVEPDPSDLLGLEYYKIVSAILTVATWVVFDYIHPTASLDDIAKQQALSSYANELQGIMTRKVSSFNETFDSEQIQEFRLLFEAYHAAISAGMAETENLVIDSNRNRYISAKTASENFNYDKYIENVKDTISHTPKSSRTLRAVGEYTISLPAEICAPTNDLEKNCAYVYDGMFRGSVRTTGEGTLCFEPNTIIAGNLSTTDAAAIHGGPVTINGSASLTGTLDNSVDMTIYGDLAANSLIANSTVHAKGDIAVSGNTNFNSLIVDGFMRQTISGNDFTVNTFTVRNSSGLPVRLSQQITVTGQYDNPSVRIDGGKIEEIVTEEITQDTVIHTDLVMTEPLVVTDAVMTVNGALSASSITLNNATLIVNGKLTLNSGISEISENSMIEVRGPLSASGTINLSGTLDIRSDAVFENTAVLNGGNLTLGGDILGAGSLSPDALVVNGLTPQHLAADNLHTGSISLSNASRGGITVDKALYYSEKLETDGSPLAGESNLVKEAA